MAEWLLHLYHRMPSTARSVMATIRGLSLRRWRFGPETERLIEEYEERERWTPERWKQWQEEQVARVLHRAATSVPYYKQLWSKRRANGDTRSWEILDNWPILKKETLRENPLMFVAEDMDPRTMYRDLTSGTSGKPLSVYYTRRTVREWSALYELRIRRWNGVSISDRWASLGGQLVVPFANTKPPFWVYNAAMRQLYFSTHHVAPANAQAYVNALNRYRPTHMIVYPSSAVVLACAILEKGLSPPPIKAVISNAEALDDKQRSLIAQGFNTTVVNTYGMCELVVSATECAHGVMHLWPEMGYLEILRDDQDEAVLVGQQGRLISTGLINQDMCLIRYEVGDRCAINSHEENCQCGRLLPTIASIEGRISDMIVTQDGRKIFWLNPAFYGLPVVEAQIIQTSLDCLIVRIVPSNGYNQRIQSVITGRLQDRVGRMQIDFEIMDKIPRLPSGKFKPVVSEIR